MSTAVQGTLYVLLSDHDVVFMSNDLDDVVGEAREYFMNSIGLRMQDGFLKYPNDAPISITQDIIDSTDVEVHTLSNETLQELPYQKWLDEDHADRVDAEKSEEEREYDHYLELHEKYKARK